MIRVNLLPHREQKRQQRKQRFFALLGVAALCGIGFVAMGMFYLDGEIEAQRVRNHFLEEDRKRLEGQITEIASLKQEIEGLRSRQNAVEDLQVDRTVAVKLFDQLVRSTPEGLYIKQMRQEGLKVSLTGLAQSNERVSELLRNFASQTEWIDRSDLVEIKAVQQPLSAASKSTRRLFEFTVVMQLRRPSRSSTSNDAPNA